MAIDERLQTITSDLLKLEISTIITDKSTSEKMSGRRALVDIAAAFREQLHKLGIDEEELPQGRGDDAEIPGSKAIFKQLEAAALKESKRRLQPEQPASEKKDVDLAMLRRVSTRCEAINDVFGKLKARVDSALTAASAGKDFSTREIENDYTESELRSRKQELAPLPLEADELVSIRKTWEIGTETIAMQTVIQIDGDVVTRVNSSFATPEYETLHKIHRDAIGTSVNTWRFLVETAGSFFKYLVGFLTGKRAPAK